MTGSLIITAGPDAGRSCDLPPGSVLVIGRAPNCGLQLSDPGVSRVHCRLIADADGVRLEDADSRYGTLVNRRPVAVRTLQPGDTIEIGDTELRFDRDSSSAETIPPQRLAADLPELMPEQSVTYDATDAPAARAGGADVERLIGTTFLRFRVESLVARTASGVSYRAVDIADQRPVALKVFRPVLFANDLAMSRFLRAMRAMVPLDHEHLIKLYAAGRSCGLCFTASEFVVGETAAQMIHRIGIAGMLDWRTIWRIAVGLADALSYLHERQIIHRSLQPGNIFIRQKDDCVKLGDSHLAKSLDQLEQLALTARGDVVGDIDYLSPEQLTDGSTADQRADIYSLGATLYALLTGRPLFVGSPAEVVRQILTASPEPPKQVQLAIPAAFEGVVLRMLAKRREDRFPDALSLLTDLQRVGRYEGLTS
jgi:pSer/pThr/pTyr-binding forkhead associated (FHA) protein